MPPIKLPTYLTIDTLPAVVKNWPASGSIELDFSDHRFVHPAGTTAIACLLNQAIREGRNVSCDFNQCANVSYWERMGFFRHFPSIPAPRSGGRRDPAGRFSEVKYVWDIDDVDGFTNELVSVVNPAADALQVYSHVVSEALNNVCQHSKHQGFCASQYYEARNQCRFSIVDYGIGLFQSLRHHNPRDDVAAVALALRPGITGRTREEQMQDPRHMRNRGVGLSAIRELVTKNKGDLTVWSGAAIYRASWAGASLNNAPRWQGTLVAATIPRTISGPPFRDIMRQLDDESRSPSARN